MKVTPYTQTVIAPRAVPQLTTGQIEGGEMAAISQATSFVSDKINEIQQKKQTRYETIQRARAVSQFKNELGNEFTNFQSENDLTDPNAAKNFSFAARKKISDYLENHEGGEDSRSSLEIQLMALADDYSMRMSESSRLAQKTFISDQMGGHINRIVGEVYANPSSIETAFKQIDGLIQEYAPALESIDEVEQLSTAHSMIIEGAINSFIDAGDYEGAQNIILDNEAYVQTMPAKQQMSILGRVNQGIAAQNRERTELKNKIMSIDSAAKAMGVDVDKMTLFSAATGINPASTPENKIAQFAKIINKSPGDLPAPVVAKIGFGVDLPTAEDIDWNQEWAVINGERAMTPKGIGVKIKPSIDGAAKIKTSADNAIALLDEFLQSGNTQASIAGVTAFLKMIDDGAVVRESDFNMSAQGNSAASNLSLAYKKITEGGAITVQQAQEIKEASKIFTMAALEAAKTKIDPYMQEAYRLGYKAQEVGLPEASYNQIFKGIKTAEDYNKRNSEIDQKAKSAGMTTAEYFTATAKKHNMTVEEVAKKLGYTGNLK